MQSMQMGHTNSNMTMMMDAEQMQMSANSSGDGNMSMDGNSSSSSMNNNTTTNIVDEAAYQSAQFVSNSTILQLFAERLKPLTLSTNQTSSNETGNATSSNNATLMTQEEGQQQQTSAGNLTSNIDELEAHLMLLRDNIENKASPIEVMTTAHIQIHPLLMQMYGLTIAPQEGGEHSEHSGA
jgi:hypothetical protein